MTDRPRKPTPADRPRKLAPAERPREPTPAERPREPTPAERLRKPTPAERPRKLAPAGRLRKLAPAELDDDQRAVYDAVAGGPRAQGPQLFPLVDAAGGLAGPFNAFLVQPRLGFAWQALGAAVRYETSLSDRAREIAILVVAVHADAAFEWYAHEAVGRHAGLTGDELDAVRTGRLDALGDDHERLVATTVHALCARGDLDDDEYRRASEALGDAGVFELLTLAGYYLALAMQLRVFRVS